MRGKQGQNFIGTRRIRITPADAGKTLGHELTIDEIQDHPRGCGENTAGGIVLDETEGSPPRMRGKH